jgi:hypothetical protein
MIMKRLIVMLSFILAFALPLQGSAISFDNNFSSNITTTSILSRFSELRNKVSPSALNFALSGYYALKSEGKLVRDGILTIIDFNKPSFDDRLFVIDVNEGRLLYSGLVAHGSGSGEIFASSFSNHPGSHQSSLGFFTTGDTYDGKHGYSLRLLGMEPGINDQAESRSIVIHGANYVSYDYIRRTGRLGRSQGCPAVSFENFQHIIDLIKGGSCLFIFKSDRDYADKSSIINSDLARLLSVPDPFS